MPLSQLAQTGSHYSETRAAESAESAAYCNGERSWCVVRVTLVRWLTCLV
jgi:hypothetical protein